MGATATEEDRRGAILLAIARDELARSLGRGPEAPQDPPADDPWQDEPWLLEPGAVFVTLKLAGALRGCVGSLVSDRPLIEDVRRNAVAAASRDPRFAPLEPSDLDAIEIEVSQLSEPEPMSFADEADALAQLRPGVDGVVLRYGERRATFLPQVWQSMPAPEAFLAQLKRKAGLAPDFWDDDVRLERYRARKWSEARHVRTRHSRRDGA